MGITRARLSFESDYVQIPNEWVRDKRLSRRARGLLAEITSHRAGWHITLRSLVANGPEGRDAIRSAINELRERGYLALVQNRGEGNKFAEVEYVLQDPAEAGDGKSVTGQGSGDGFSGDGIAGDGESDPKNTIPEEDHPAEDQRQDSSRRPTFRSAEDQGDDEGYPQGSPQFVDMSRIAGHIATQCGREVAPVVVQAIVGTILERAKEYPTMPTKYVSAAITRDPFGWQKYIDGGKAPR